jgi:hypothetical protein
VKYFCKYLSIAYLGRADLSPGDKNAGDGGFPYIDRTAGGDAVIAASGKRLDLRPDERWSRQGF